MTPIKHASTMVNVTDVDRARRFYADCLGLMESGGSGGNRVYRTTDGSTIELHCIPNTVQSEHTALTFEVDDLDGAIRDLEGKGVRFEDYDLPDLKTENHVATMGDDRAAWFRDPEGNVLCLHEVRH